MGRVIKQRDLKAVPLPLKHADARLFSLIDAQREKARFIADAMQGTIELSVQMAQKLVGDAVERRPDVLKARYQEALSLIDGLSPGVVSVHPQGQTQPMLADLAEENGFTLCIDNSLHPADCIVEAGGVRVDSTLETTMALFKTALKNAKSPLGE